MSAIDQHGLGKGHGPKVSSNPDLLPCKSPTLWLLHPENTRSEWCALYDTLRIFRDQGWVDWFEGGLPICFCDNQAPIAIARWILQLLRKEVSVLASDCKKFAQSLINFPLSLLSLTKFKQTRSPWVVRTGASPLRTATGTPRESRKKKRRVRLNERT